MALGSGSVPVDEAITILKEVGFAGSWVLELRNMTDALASAERLTSGKNAGFHIG